MARSYLHYDVFTGDPLLGNALAVFPDAGGLDAGLMQRLAREMAFPESTFVLPPEWAGTDARLRIFSPAVELPMAGHPTIGAAFALAELGVIRPGTARVILQLNIGPIPVDLEWGDGRLTFAWMTQPNPAFGPIVADRQAVAAALGLDAADLLDGRPVQEISCGVPFLFVPLRDREAVDRAVPDASAQRRLAASTGVDVALFPFAVSASGEGAEVYSRMFASGFGIVEDPATGSASGPLGCYLVRHGLVSGDAMQRIVSHQGVKMGRASRIHVAIAVNQGLIADVRVGGEAVLVGRGELLV